MDLEAAVPTENLALRADARLSLALDVARLAGRLALPRTGRTGAAWKRTGERVTSTDLAAQTAILESVRDRFPEDGLLAEEGVHAAGLDREFVWVIDPLDGTNNYVAGLPCFAVSIGVLRAGSPHAGVVHDPSTGFTCWALRDRGAHAAGRRLALAGTALGATSNVCVRVPLDRALEPVIVGWLRRCKLRQLGSVALHLAYAAFGAIDLVVDHRAALWDIAGGAAALLEAGGALTTPAGTPIFPVDLAAYRGEAIPFVGGNPGAHDEAVRACRAEVGPEDRPEPGGARA